MKTSKLIIDKKRCGEALGSAEIRQFINGFVSGEIPDYQMSALAMAICCRGMTDRETADLTDVMMKSGRVLQWGDLITADKHSTGGVGDKLSLIIQPLASSCGVAVPSLTGRALGLTGGTADKLETIPGYNASLSIEEFTRIVREVGVSMTVQTDEITPADRKLYALRDVTGTVASIPLIVASILSKKLAEGAGTLVFDVKCGSGAFMKTPEEAMQLARRLVDGAKAAGRKAAALVSDMSQPLGSAIGNANEVKEAIDILSGSNNALYSEEIKLSIELAALMVSLSKDIKLDEARVLCEQNLSNGFALVKFREMVEAHGGSLSKFEDLLSKPVFRFKIQAMRSGYISSIDAGILAAAAFELGTGRKKQGDKIDPLAGIRLDVKKGDRVSVGAPLATLERSICPDGLEAAASILLKAFTISPDKPELGSVILERVVS